MSREQFNEGYTMSNPAEEVCIEGVFWIANQSDNKADGILITKRGCRAELSLNENLKERPSLVVDQHLGEHSFTESFRMPTVKESIDRFSPVTVHGQLSDGSPVTAFNAQNYGGFSSTPQYKTEYLVQGDHVDDESTYTAIRVLLHNSTLISSLTSPSTKKHGVQSGDLKGCLSSETFNGQSWIVYRTESPQRIRHLCDNIAFALQLFVLCLLDKEWSISDVSLEKEGRWLAVKSPHLFDTAKPVNWGDLMDPSSLSLDRAAKFISINHTLDGLTEAVVRPIKGTAIQAMLLTNCSIAEGFHRRLYSEKRRFPDASKETLKLSRSEAVNAGGSVLVQNGICDEKAAKTLFNNALGHINEISYHDRLDDIVEELSPILPELFAPFTCYSKQLKEARNKLAHYLPQAETGENTIDGWIALNYMTPWILRVLILHRIGVSNREISRAFIGTEQEPGPSHRKVTRSHRFSHDFHNSSQISKELGWS